MQPSISVCIPVYNIPPVYLAETVASVLALRGECGRLEVIVNDDISSVDYSEVLASFPSDVVQYFRNEENLGMVGNWNRSIRRSRGALVMVLGHDDLLVEGMFHTYGATFAADPAVVLCSCHKVFIDEEGREVTLKRQVNDRRNIFMDAERYELSHREVARLCLLNGNAIGEPSCVMYRREAFDRIGGYDDRFEHAADVDFNIRIAGTGKTVFHNRVFCKRRIHGTNLTFSNLAAGRVSRDRVRLFERHALANGFSKQDIAHFEAYLFAKSGYDCLRNARAGEWEAVRFACKTAFRFLRLRPIVYAAYLAEIFSGKNRSAR